MLRDRKNIESKQKLSSDLAEVAPIADVNLGF
jgi:hypothetical protein